MHICVACAPDMVVSSPDEQNSISLSLDSQGVLNYQIKSGDDILVSQSVIGLLAKDESLSFNNGLELVEACSRVIDEKYNLPTGKCSSYTNYANEKHSFSVIHLVKSWNLHAGHTMMALLFDIKLLRTL